VLLLDGAVFNALLIVHVFDVFGVPETLEVPAAEMKGLLLGSTFAKYPIPGVPMLDPMEFHAPVAALYE